MMDWMSDGLDGDEVREHTPTHPSHHPPTHTHTHTHTRRTKKERHREREQYFLIRDIELTGR